MRNDLMALMESASDGLSKCAQCPFRGQCLFATDRYDPGQCLHEYKLLHAFVARRLRAQGTLDAAAYARLDAETARYAEYLRTHRPFDPRLMSNVAPAGPSVPFAETTPQSNLMAFGAP